MNFLSHFYFDRHSANPERVLGTVLPDLIRNANKNWVIHPEKRQNLTDSVFLNIIEGWKRHIEVDRLFHGSNFFMEHSRSIRIAIIPALENSPVRPSFLSHVALELMLDSLLFSEGLVNPDDFYNHLGKVNRKVLTQFLELNEIDSPGVFFHFFDRFISSAYLKHYNDPGQIVYALNRICMRLWKDPLNDTHKEKLIVILLAYNEKLRKTFMDIFNEIEAKL